MLRTRRWSLLALAGGAAVVVAAGCATIIHGSRQDVSVASTPTGAHVVVDGAQVGETPYVARLSRKERHTVRVELDGYHPYEVAIRRSTSGWVWGNIVFGGLIGLAVDAITGGIYKLEPAEIEAVLNQTGGIAVEERGDALVVTFAMQPDPAWERIGTLTPE